MSYQTYTTEAFVCGSSASKTSDKSFLLFTRDAGMLFATARSVREEASKQRQALQDFSHVRVSLVKGKSGWRIGSVEALRNAFMESEGKPARVAVTHITKLVRRYVHGESAIPEVFDDFAEALKLASAEDSAERDGALLVFHVRLLARLGYVATNAALAPVLDGALNDAIPRLNPSLAASIDKVTKAASAASHL